MLFVTLLTWKIFAKFGGHQTNILQDMPQRSMFVTVFSYAPLAIMVSITEIDDYESNHFFQGKNRHSQPVPTYTRGKKDIPPYNISPM